MQACSQSKLAPSLAVACSLLWPWSEQVAAQRVDCTRQQLATLFVSVTDQTTRAPLRNALITTRWQDALVRQNTARTDSTGRATLCVPLHQNVTLRASYVDIDAPAPIAFSQNGPVATQAISIDVPGSLVRGRVFDQQSGSRIRAVRGPARS